MSAAAQLGELASRILSELEEAGSENICSTMNTVMTPTGVAREIAETILAINELLRADLIYLCHWDEKRRQSIAFGAAETEECLANLALMLSFDETRRFWMWNKATPIVEIAVTRLGSDAAFEVLDTRGYQWWRKKT